MTVDKGDKFSIYLCGDPSTGRRWTNPLISDSDISEFDYAEFVVGLDVEDVETAGVGKRRWRGKAVSTGQTTLRSDYKLPGSTEPERAFELVLTVK